jgi:putative ABC transport system permease protein
MEAVWQDLRHALRSWRRAPGFAAAAVATLALGMGANTAMFSIVHAVMLRPLPYAAPDRLVRVQGGTSFPDLQDWAGARAFEGFGGYRAHFFDLTGRGAAERVDGALVTGDLFRLLGARAERGRLLQAEDDRPGGLGVVVLGHGFWQRRLGGDPDVVGSTLRFSTGAYEVVGVAPAGFRLPEVDAEVWAPLQVESPEEAAARGAHSLMAVGRLREGLTGLRGAQAEMDGIAARLAAAHPDENKDRRFVLAPLHEFLVRDVRGALVLLLGAVAFVLLIAATNVANLLLARAAAREKEIAIRASLGAGRARLVRQLLAESVLLAAVGGAAGLLLAHWLIDVVVRTAPPGAPGLDAVRLDARVLAFTAGVSLVTGLVFGLIPGLSASRVSLVPSLKEGGRTSGTATRARLRGALVVSQVALALMLLVGAGLLLRSLHRLQSVDPGFDPRHLVTFNLTPPMAGYGDIAKRTRLFEDVLARLAARPGVAAVGATSELPFGTGSVYHNFVIDGRPPLEPGREPEIYNRSASPSFFGALGLPVRRGRALSEDDRATSPLVCVVNEAAVREHFAGEDPIGRRIAWARAPERIWITIVGVVGDVHAQELAAEEVPAVYTPMAQEMRAWKTWMNFAVRTAEGPETFAAAARREVAAVDPDIPVTRVRAMDDLIAASVAPRRFNLLLLGGFAILALLLAAVGLHGVVSHAVAQRTQEMGVRVALGAAPRDVVRLVVGQGLALTLAGLLCGAAGALALTRFVSTMLFGVRATDPGTFLAVSALLVVVSLLACYRPARRAARVDPLVALRGE